MTRTHDISELVSRAQRGDRESLGLLSARVRRRVFIYLYRMTLDYHLAEDLVQETVLYMIESLPRLKTTSSLSLWAWIYRSAWGIFRHYIRPQGHQRIVQKTVVDHEALLKLTDEAKETALERAERSELVEAICKSLGMLRTKHRNVLVLRCFEQLSHAEIALVMGCSELKARVLFFHAKRALKRQLHNRGFGRRYFLASLSLFGLITGMHTRSASAAITVTSSLSKTRTIATTIGAITAKLGLVKTAVVTTGLVVGTLHVCSSDADVPAEPTVNIVTGGGENIFSVPEKMDNAEIADLLPTKGDADPVLPDPCGYEPHEPAGMPPPVPVGSSQPAMPAGIAQPAVQVDLLADPNEIRTRIESFDGLAEAIRDAVAGSASEQRHWAQTKYDNRTSLARAVHRRVADELALVRKIAVEEKAEKTAEAIDVLAAEKEARYKAVGRELLKQLRQVTAARGTQARGRYGRSSAGAEGPPGCKTQDEIRRWTQATVGNKSDLARATHDRICSEMALIRSIATEEQAAKTTAAIDGLLLQRKECFDAFMSKALEEIGSDQTIQAAGRMRGRTRGGRAVHGAPHQMTMQSGSRRRR
ncbi:MAG: RNA polymerase sigma factor [Planctomycetota bacterium]